MNQKGFATLEVILMVTVIGILAAVAVPRFTDITAKANTAKIQADLSTLDSAIAIYEMETGSPPSQLSDLKNYIQDLDNLKPPTGNAFQGGSESVKINSTSYAITEKTVEGVKSIRATLDGKTAGEYGKK